MRITIQYLEMSKNVKISHMKSIFECNRQKENLMPQNCCFYVLCLQKVIVVVSGVYILHKINIPPPQPKKEIAMYYTPKERPHLVLQLSLNKFSKIRPKNRTYSSKTSN